MVVGASFLNGFGWFLPPLYFSCQIFHTKDYRAQYDP